MDINRIQVSKNILEQIKNKKSIIRIPINRRTSTSCGSYYNKKFWSGHDFNELWRDELKDDNFEYLHVAYYHPEEPRTKEYKCHHRVRCAAETGELCVFYCKKNNFGIIRKIKFVEVDISRLEWIIGLSKEDLYR